MSCIWQYARKRWYRARCQRFCSLALLFVAILACTACGNTSAEAAASRILAHVEGLHLIDATLNVSVTATYQGKYESSSGTMKFIKNPPRYDALLKTAVNGIPRYLDEIADISGGVIYARLVSTPGQPDSPWSKLSFSDSSFGYVEIFAFENLTNARLVDTETLDGVAVWRIHGDLVGGLVDANADIFIRQDTYYPVHANITESGSAPAKLTLGYTAFNSGISIALPSGSQVQGG